jgi:hypothetical protein
LTKLILALIAGCALALAPAIPAAAAPLPPPSPVTVPHVAAKPSVPPNTYRICDTAATQRCINAQGAHCTSGTPVVGYTLAGQLNEDWQIWRGTDGAFYLSDLQCGTFTECLYAKSGYAWLDSCNQTAAQDKWAADFAHGFSVLWTWTSTGPYGYLNAWNTNALQLVLRPWNGDNTTWQVNTPY